MPEVAVGRTNPDLPDSVTPGVTEGGASAAGDRAVIDAMREGRLQQGLLGAGREGEDGRTEVPERGEADLMRTRLCFHGSTVLDRISGEAEPPLSKPQTNLTG